MSDEKEKQPRIPAYLQAVFTQFSQSHSPASSFDQADEQLTTTEICELIEDLVGSEQERHVIFTLLTKNGYTYQYIVDGFKWLIKRNN